MTLLALIGAKSLYLLYVWLISAALASYLSERKGYGEKPGLAMGLLLFVIGPIFWLAWPAKPESKWRTVGIVGTRTKADRAAAGARDRKD